MIYLRLFFEFFQVGLFSVGGGLATIPFLNDMGLRTGWFTPSQVANMLAISESTPGPIGVNMATYTGFHVAGVPGGVIATLGLVTPSILVILIIGGFLKKFRENRTVNAIFYALRPASTALISAALLQVCSIALMVHSSAAPESNAASAPALYWPAILLAGVVFACLHLKPLKRLHPVVFIVLSAAVGILFRL